MLKQAAVIAVAACAAVLAAPAEAFAGGGSGAVQCQGQGCTLYAQNPGSRGRAGVTADGGPPAGGAAAKPACTAGGVAGTPVTYLGRFGTARACVTPGGVPGGAAPAAAPAPAVLAQAAESRLGLGSPVIKASPAVGLDQLVHVPTWLWLAGPWAPVRATAAVPGEQVTATATPQRVTWHMGDGSVVTCHGPGTPYQPSDNPASPSPTCGHTYARSSAAAPGGEFRVTATITWVVTWTGGGGAGAFPGLVTTSAVRVPVAQSQALVTGPA